MMSKSHVSMLVLDPCRIGHLSLPPFLFSSYIAAETYLDCSFLQIGFEREIKSLEHPKL